MNNLIDRKAISLLKKYMKIFPAVAVLGSRQCGKSTMVKMMGNELNNILYVDLQNKKDLAMLTDPTLFFEHNEDKIVCLDEVQLLPELFSYLRSEIDRKRTPGRFVLLGSASRELLQHTSETLAGRVGMIDLTPFLISEVSNTDAFSLSNFWFRGGYPDSFLAISDEASCIWRENFIRTYIERDIPQLGFMIAAPKMQRMLAMLAHEHGCILNAAKFASAMDLSATTIRHYIDITEQTYIVRTLQPFFKNTKKRLVKTPRIYLRDVGLLHQILQINNYNELLANPIFGLSWEGLVVENVCASVRNAKFSFYRSSDGTEEFDLLIEFPDEIIAVECKASTSPQPTSSLWNAKKSIEPSCVYIVCPLETQYAIADNVEVVGLNTLLNILSSRS